MNDIQYRILVWGTGTLAKKVVKYSENWNILGYIESNPCASFYEDKKVFGPYQIPDDYDYIIVANSHANEIERTIKKIGIPLQRIIFFSGTKIQNGVQNEQILKEVLGNANFDIYCSEYGIIDKSTFFNDAKEYEKKNIRDNFKINYSNIWPIISDKYGNAGKVHNYFWQDLWAAKKIISKNPQKHYDIGSRLDGFIAHLLAADISVKMIDIRHFPVEINGLSTIVDDATELKQFKDNSIESLSALCSLEHFGLGRYGDPIDPEACFKCFDNIVKKLKIGGRLYISLPIGRERIEFNAHRIFYAGTVVDCFKELELVEFSCSTVDRIEKNVPLHKYDNDMHNGEYRYGLFEFKK